MSQSFNISQLIGKPIKDEHGRLIGEVISFTIRPDGSVEQVYIKRNDGTLTKYPVINVTFNGPEVVYVSGIKTEANILCNQIPLIWRKDQVLKELYDKKKVPAEIYEDLHNNFEGVLNQLKTRAQNILEKIDKEIERCNNEIRELNYALTYLEVEHEIGGIDDTSYQAAYTAIQGCLKQVDVEKADLESLRNKLSNILLGETIHEPSAVKIAETPIATPIPISLSSPQPQSS
jgi:archaellum component FlaC